jgi:signal transduction histidine kinase
MINELRDKYLTSKTQIIILDKSTKVIESEKLLFDIPLGSQIEDFHPFFYVLKDIFETDNIETVFNGVHIEFKEKQKVVDLIVNSGNNNQNPFLILVDFTYYYNNFQSVAQEKNESILSFYLEEIKNKQLQSEKEFKDKFLANVSHDLKTPIWGTNFFLGMLEKTELTAEQIEFVSTIKETNNHIYQLVEDLLDLSKIESGQMNILKESFDFKESLNHLQSIIGPKVESKNLKFVFEIDGTIPKNLIGDKVRLNQILINLLDNSIKFTTSGTISLIIREVNRSNQNISLLFQVKDTGSGISTSKKKDVFLSFKKLHSSEEIEGLGLGLSIVSSNR